MAQFRPISEAAFKRAQAKADKDQTPFAESVRFNRRTDVLQIKLNTGPTISIPRNCIATLNCTPEADFAGVTIEGGGSVLCFPKADIYLSIAPLLEQFFGPTEWGRRERRAAASRENGKRGGRPKSADAKVAQSAEEAVA